MHKVDIRQCVAWFKSSSLTRLAALPEFSSTSHTVFHPVHKPSHHFERSEPTRTRWFLGSNLPSFRSKAPKSTPASNTTKYPFHPFLDGEAATQPQAIHQQDLVSSLVHFHIGFSILNHPSSPVLSAHTFFYPLPFASIKPPPCHP